MEGGNSWTEEIASIEVRAVDVNDAPALHDLDYSFETDRIYTLRVHGLMAQHESCSQRHTINLPCF